jgi:VanZ family protein
MGAISFFSSVPARGLPDVGVIGADKFAHFSEFMVLGIVLTRAMLGMMPKISLFRSVFLSIIIAVLYAAADEVYQIFIPGRQADILDFVMDFFGLVTGTLLYLRRHQGAKDKAF